YVMLSLFKQAPAASAKRALTPARTGTLRGLSPTGFHSVAYVDWGPLDDSVPIVCVHGLSRQGRDFDYRAAALADTGRRVVCPDLAARGQGGRLKIPARSAWPHFAANTTVLTARRGSETIAFLAPSPGGLIGIVLAGLPGNPIRRLVINDIGPFLPWSG